ncbi:Sulfate adenylyltransferase subunit 2 [Buchnera aphidicola (Eriosoma grossulariae)]|uniref:sulfate adenylyltransferase subunit CysD n=1 Tax=Buchnera aphidicola TaxID=9 RepID=UPI0034641F8F
MNKNHFEHLRQLESESIYIFREVIAEFNNPVILYSVGKDSSVMLHLARKAFYPGKIPVPLLHVDTGWKFQEMYTFRKKIVKNINAELIVYKNPDGMKLNITPFTYNSSKYTDLMKTEGLKQAIDKYQFDAAFGGARRDEEKSRSKERIYSFRDSLHRWNPKEQRPELWNNYNGKINKGESIRVFPLSNWTELDIWEYIFLEGIEVVPLYYASLRPILERDGKLLLVDNENMKIQCNESVSSRMVRFRTLGCWPLTSAIESTAQTLPEIIQETLISKISERSGRSIDYDQQNSMELKKKQGYF